MSTSSKNVLSLEQHTRLNPNAAEFVPVGRTSGFFSGTAATKDTAKAVLTRTSSVNSSTSDDERRKYWQAQLPDDIIPDFDFVSEATYDRLSVNRGVVTEQDSVDFSTKLLPSSSFDGGQGLSNGNESCLSRDLAGERFLLDNGGIDPIDLLVSEFPGFAAGSLADVFCANGGDLSLTIEMLTQLQLQEDAAPGWRSQSQPSFSPNLNMSDFPALAGPELANGLSQFNVDANAVNSARARVSVGLEDLFTCSSYASGGSRGAEDFAAVVRKNAAVQWQHGRNGRIDHGLGSSRIFSQSTEGDSYAGDSRARHGEKLEHRHQSQLAPPIWLETGEAVSSIYADLRDEARDHARVRNAYFEQARQSYLAGNKALAKDLSMKGQWHNELMKDAHNKAGEAIFRQRNLSTGGFAQGQPRLLDLHGLHVNEAIPLLKRELAAIRVAARLSTQQQQVFICVGTGHHTKGSRTPARLPIAVEKFLAEDERLPFIEQQPGMLSVFLR